MPETKGRRMTSTSAAERSGGFFIARVVSPGAAAAGPPRPRRPRVLTPEDNKENVAPQGCGRRRRSPLPVWYPRTPLRDITTIVQVLEARRARRAQQRRIDAEASPEILALASSPARQTPVTTIEASPAAPQRTPETHQMLCSKLTEIEKSAKAYMKRATKQPSKMITARRTLMSMR